MFCLAITSCGLEEPYGGLKNNEGVIEFVARPVGFNNQTVETKATANTFESAIYSCYLLVFDSNSGNLLQRSEASLNQNIKLNVKSGNIKACFLVNVTKTFAENIKGITRPEGSTEDPNFYLNSAVLDITYADHTVADNDTETSGIIGIPSVNFGGTIGTKKCLPMYGEWSGSVAGKSTIQVPIKRLFAKVTMNIKMQLTNVGVGQIAPSTVNYELRQYQLHNLPTKVRLVVDDSESDWVGTASAFYANAITPQSSNDNLGLQTININDSDNNADNNSDVVKGIEFSFYVPEYYLSPKANPTQDQKCKPENYDFKNKYAIYVKLSGEVNRSLIDNTTIYHKIYLGENGTDNYTLKRNRHYINQITIMGIENNADGEGDNLDHRVTSETVNNPVANAGKAANCYIIATPGKYTIPAYKGAYNNLNGATLCMEGKNLSEYDTKVEILANVVEYESITSITFSESPTYDPQTNTISFTVDKMLTDNWVPNGSVIMALKYKKKGESTWTTEWSWHLWFVFKVGKSEDGWGAIGYQDMPGGNDKMMDRNLGVNAATSAGTKAGFYYKYGEHTPYLDPDGDGVYTQFGGGSVSNSTPRWNVSGKSVTDPCPPGYKVPSSSVWYDSKQDNMSISNTSFTYRPAISLQGISLEPIYYPISGHVYKDANNNYQSDNSKIIKNQDSYINLPIEVVKRGDKGKKNSYRFIKIVTNEKIVDNFGLALGADKTENLYYANRQTEKTSKGIQYNLGTAKGYTALTGIDWDNTVLTMTIDKFKSDFYAQYLMLEAYKEILQGMENVFTSEIVYTTTESIDENNGYQVRCIKE